MSSKVKAKKPAAKKAAAPSKKAAPKAVKASAKTVSKKTAAPAKAAKPAKKEAPKKVEAAQSETDKRKAKAAAAVKAAMASSNKSNDSEEEDEFDPAAFFAASGGKGLFKAHVMRKERVDFNLTVRYRFLTGPLVFNADLLNLSKGGLCLKTEEVIKAKAVLRIEIPLPHTSELFAIQAECVWSDAAPGGVKAKGPGRNVHTGLKFLPMSLAKQTVINQFIQQRRDEIIMAKIGLDKFTDSVPVAGLD
ncbi:MAG: PilZ domain-containing protein [Bdellovibrionales bacterium]|nr:PilZ domain-containing protein [Bdellovibrionales bacterium]